jgi:O-antigen ligase
VATFLLSIYFQYLYHILNEIREYDSRPLLKIRHGDANFLCTILSFAIPMGIYTTLKFKYENKIIISAAFGIMTFNIIIAAILTQSRMGLSALVIAIVYLFLKKELKIRKLSLITVLISLLVTLFIFGQSIVNRFENIADKSNADRMLTYINGIKIIENSPYFGVGMHNAKNFFYQNTQYPHFQSEFHQLDIHNTYLKIFAELGVFAFIALIVFIFKTIQKSNRNNNLDKNFIISSLLIIIISSLTIGISYKDFYYIELIIIFSLASRNITGEKNV